MPDGGNGRSPSKDIAAAAVMCALLTGGQAALAAVRGIEVVTVLLLSFAWVYGPRAGALAAVGFSLLRCVVWGFYPSVVVLYLIYYPAFALLFGALGRVKDASYARFPVWAAIAVNAVSAAVCAACAVCAATDILKISSLSVAAVKALLWAAAALALLLLVAFDVAMCLSRAGKIRGAGVPKTIIAAAVAAACTICFTLLDDFIAPLFLGYAVFSPSWAAYFYASFLSLAPQTVCAVVTVSTLFLPLTAVFKRVAKYD